MIESKAIIQKLVTKFDSINNKDYDKQKVFQEFIKPLFESLGWNFQTDISIPKSISENKADYAFKIDNVSRFYLSVIPPSKSINDLEQIRSLTTFAFNKGVTWAILTNFKELRIYNVESPGTTPASMQHYSFTSSEYITKFENLQDLTKHQFSLNILDSDAELFGKKPKRISVDNQLLKDLLVYRDALVNDITENNSINEEEAQHVAQKILNRIIFIRSCGDRKIEERHLISSLNEWDKNKNKKLNEYLHETFAYFRGRYGSSLFEKHSCDDLEISDDVLAEIILGLNRSKKRSVSYDFSLISSDILGKMYENYLGIIQRKEDGAYYTPNYISKYICNNTIIPYLSKSDVTNITDLILEYSDNIEELESKIHNIKILDLACGTGEFLIRAIDVLQKISKAIQNLKGESGRYSHTVKKKKSGNATFETFDRDIEDQELRRIIQNNIYGIDINEEAIEITQLNLFLKLATSSQKLLDISKNLQIGNSLVEDKKIDSSAFNWNNFPKKFDIIIGNPPYIRIQEIKRKSTKLAKYFSTSGYQSATKNFDLSVLFIEKGCKLLQENGILGYITTNKFLNGNYGIGIRNFISNKKLLSKLIDFGDQQIFSGASTYTCLLFLEKQKNEFVRYAQIKNIIHVNDSLKKIEHNEECNSKDLLSLKIKKNRVDENPWIFLTDKEQKIFDKTDNYKKLGKITEIYQGITSSADSVFLLKFILEKENNFEVFSNNLEKTILLEKDLLKYLLKGTDIAKWTHEKFKNLLFFPFILKNGKNELIDEKTLSSFPNTYNYLKKCKTGLSARKLPSSKKSFTWYDYVYRKNLNKFLHKKILTQVLAKKSTFALDSTGVHYFVGGGNAGIYGIQIRDEDEISYEYLLGLLNSSFLDWRVKKKSSRFHDGYYSYAKRFIEDLPIIISKNNPLVKKIEKLVREILSKRESINELEDEKNVTELKTEIQKMEYEIDQIVYKLYEITDEEKVIIESLL